MREMLARAHLGDQDGRATGSPRRSYVVQARCIVLDEAQYRARAHEVKTPPIETNEASRDSDSRSSRGLGHVCETQKW